MGYIEKNLMADEKVVYRTHLHPVVYIGAVLLGVVALPAAIVVPVAETMSRLKIAGLILLVAGGWFSWIKVIVITSEFAVTTKRVLIKTGFIARDAWEMHLLRIEGVQIEQGFLGRMLNFGTVTIRGVGGSSDPFTNISNPLEFRRAVTGQMDNMGKLQPDDTGKSSNTGALSAPPGCAETGNNDIEKIIEENKRLRLRGGRDVVLDDLPGMHPQVAASEVEPIPSGQQERIIPYLNWEIPGRDNSGVKQ